MAAGMMAVMMPMSRSGLERDGVEKGNYRPKRNRNIYAAYRGDDYIGEGTLDDIAALAGVNRKTAQWCARPAALRRIEERSKAWDAGGRRLKTRGSLVLVLVEAVDESRTG